MHGGLLKRNGIQTLSILKALILLEKLTAILYIAGSDWHVQW